MRFLFTSALFSLLVYLLSSCKPMPNDGIPFYLRIDSVSVAGGNTHHITDVWAEANATQLGAYELPCNFPVLEENEVRMVLNAGIEESGRQDARVNYPFYLADTFTLTAVRGEKYSRSPVFQYKSGAQFAVNENFEAGNGFSGFNRITIPLDTNILYGNACGKVSVSAIDSNREAKQINAVTLPAGQEVWLEVDYKCEVPFYIGFYANYTGTSSLRTEVLFVTAHPTWNKLYVKLSYLIGTYRADSYQFYFEALRPYGSIGGSVYVDNVKVVHF